MSIRKRNNARRVRSSSTRTEGRVAKEHGGRRTPLSGADFEKADGRVMGKYRIENKETKGLTYRLHIDDLNKLSAAAMLVGEIPLFHITLTERAGRRREFVVLRYEDHLGLIKELEYLREERNNSG